MTLNQPILNRLATHADLPGILRLQDANLRDNLTEEQQAQGFVTTPFTTAQLEQLIALTGLYVADQGGQIQGYTMSAGWDYFAQWPIFPFMIERLQRRQLFGTAITASNSFQYGPVCVAASLRGTGTFPRLFEAMRLDLAARFPVGITFINRTNRLSYGAHTKTLGMTVVEQFEFMDREYWALAFDTSRSVLKRTPT
jgi:hypothetical protein